MKMIDKTIGSVPYRIITVDSPNEFIEPTLTQSYSYANSNYHLSMEDFTGRAFTNWDDLRSAFNSVSKETLISLDLIDKLKSQIESPKTIKRRVVWESELGEPCVDRYLTGEENFLRNMKKRRTVNTRHVTLRLNVSAVHYLQFSSYKWRSIALTVIADLLEQAGYQVSVKVYAHQQKHVNQGKRNSLTIITLKESDYPIDVSFLTNSTSSWYYRAVLFCHFISCHNAAGNQGYHADCTNPELIQYFDIGADSTDIEIKNTVRDEGGVVSEFQRVLKLLDS